MARLERDVGQALFTRSGRGVTLTPAGRRLQPNAQRCVVMADDAVAAVRAEGTGEPIRVAMHATFAPSLMPTILDALAALDVGVIGSDAHTEAVITMLADGTADIGVVVPWPHPATVRVEPFRDEPVVCVARADHPLGRRRRLELRDLAEHQLAGNAWGDGAEEFLGRLRATPVPHHRFHVVSPAETVASLVRKGSHVGVLTRYTVEDDLASGRLVELPVTDLPRWHVTLALAYRDEDAGTDHVGAVRTAVGASS